MAVFSTFQCQVCSLSMCVLVVFSGLVTTHVLNRKHYVKPSCLKQQPSCLTLSQLSSSNITSNTTLVFLPGNHFLSSNFTARNVIWFSMIKSDSHNDTVTINCNGTARLTFDNAISTHMCGLTFTGCKDENVRVVELYNSSVTFENCSFVKSGGVNISNQSNISFLETNFEENTAKYGGAIASYSGSVVSISKCNFSSNSAINYGGAIYALDSDLISITGSRFTNNLAPSQGGALHMGHAAVVINDSEFYCNSANLGLGGAVYIWSLHSLSIGTSWFCGNSAFRGSDLRIYWQLSTSITVTITNCSFTKHRVCTMVCPDHGISRSGADSEAVFLTDTTTLFNSTEFSGIGGSLAAATVLLDDNTCCTDDVNNSMWDMDHSYNSMFKVRGAITSFQSDVLFYGKCTFYNNYAQDGGALNAVESKVHTHGEVLMKGNMANNSGGGIYLYQSELNCHGNSTLKLKNNTACMKGGGIYAISSSIKVVHDGHHKSTVIFKRNRAMMGGGIYLEASAKLYVLKSNNKHRSTASLQFKENSAKEGGAIYVNDTNPVLCQRLLDEFQSDSTECFVQVFTLQPKLQVESEDNARGLNIEFTNNFAQSGHALFGGLLDRCTVSQFANVNTVRDYRQISSNGVKYFTDITNINVNSSGSSSLQLISSKAVRVCFCSENVPDCSYQPAPMTVRKGTTITVTLVAVDQVNHTIPNSTIRTALPNYETRETYLDRGERYQNTSDGCTDLKYNISTYRESETLVFSAKGPCWDAALSVRSLRINFKPCRCPVGFESYSELCQCECASCISTYITNCDPKTETVMRRSNIWLTYVNNSESDSSCNYLIYHHCPLDYCASPNKTQINMNVENGADAQCANYHSGTLCGSCKTGFSLSLGTSHCIKCPAYWPAVLIGTIAFAVVGGIVLVGAILVLNLTVAVGTLNGIIFYCNIVSANGSTFLPFSVPNFITVFIAWMNLDSGMDICLFKGMDAYWKTWLQLAYPAFVIFMVMLVIMFSKVSTRFSGLIGKRNPVATLATLILLSYTKLLRTIIAALSFAVLNYPNGSYRTVWLYDGTIGYLHGKHNALFTAAILILLVGVAYTVLLSTWQWLLYLQGRKCLWIRSQRLHLFLEPYHAPYTPAHRYWTGLHLLVRIILYSITAVNVSRNPRVNLLSISTIITCLLFLKGSFRDIYRNRLPGVLETICYLNIILLCTTKLYILDNQSESIHKALAYVSVSVTFALFLAVLTYHTFTEIITKVKSWKKLSTTIMRKGQQITTERTAHAERGLGSTICTRSVIDGPSFNNGEAGDDNLKRRSWKVKFHNHSELREVLLESGEQ